MNDILYEILILIKIISINICDFLIQKNIFVTLKLLQTQKIMFIFFNENNNLTSII